MSLPVGSSPYICLKTSSLPSEKIDELEKRVEVLEEMTHMRRLTNFFEAFLCADHDFIEKLSQITQIKETSEPYLFSSIDKKEYQVCVPASVNDVSKILSSLATVFEHCFVGGVSTQEWYESILRELRAGEADLTGTAGIVCFMLMEACQQENIPYYDHLFESLGDKLTAHKSYFGPLPEGLDKEDGQTKETLYQTMKNVWEENGHGFVAKKIASLKYMLHNSLDETHDSRMRSILQSLPDLEIPQ